MVGQDEKEKSAMSIPRVMTIAVLFHISGYRCLKDFYLEFRHLLLEMPPITGR